MAHRLALDHPEKVEKMMVLDIAPTLWMYEHTNMDFVRPLGPDSSIQLIDRVLGEGLLALVLPHPTSARPSTSSHD